LSERGSTLRDVTAPAPFVPGLELAGAFYAEVVGPALSDVDHAAALLGWGSDVLGFDTERSTDHGWGPRVQVFVSAGDVALVRARVDAALPERFRGWPTRFGWDEIPVSSHIEIAPLADWLHGRLAFDALSTVSTLDWLATPQQALLEVTSGAVFHDPGGEIGAVRDALAWYPDEVWRWMLACQWRRIDQEEPFVGRAAEVGDELGSRVVAARLVRDLMRLCFLLERRYAPYSKWLGSAFARLDVASALAPALDAVLAADDYGARETALVGAVETLAARHNALGITERLDECVRLFHGRPFRVLGSGRFVDACLESVTDPWLRALPLVGGIDQWVDSTDVLSDSSAFSATAAAYRAWASDRGHA
jgi:hypothetical protein